MRGDDRIVLTVNGNAEVVLHDAQSHQQLVDILEFAEAIKCPRTSLYDIKKDRAQSSETVIGECLKK